MLIHNVTIVNEGRSFRGFVATQGQFITSVGEGNPEAQELDAHAEIIDGAGQMLLPGIIDDQVHFREPGMTEKGDIFSESRAAVAGGITSFMEMPNTKPAATTHDLLEQKYEIAAERSAANYSFYMGASNDNLAEITRVDPRRVCGVKVFMGSSTGDMLVDRLKTLEGIFAECPTLIATHCEDETTVSENLRQAYAQFGDDIPIELHPAIRSVEACYKSSSLAAELATKYGSRLHILHISTERELSIFDAKPVTDKKITAEICAHHLWFSEADYPRLGMLIKCNPAIKTIQDRDALRNALTNNKLDVVATDHAPHTLEQKRNPYTKAPSGLPLVQHSLQMMLAMEYTPEMVVNKMCHTPADLFHIDRRGYIRKGYYADLVMVSADNYMVTKGNIKYKCGWSPLEGATLPHTIKTTIINGKIVWHNNQLFDRPGNAQRLTFNR